MELCEEGDLNSYLKRNGGKLCEKDARYIIKDVLKGLCFMFERFHVMH